MDAFKATINFQNRMHSKSLIQEEFSDFDYFVTTFFSKMTEQNNTERLYRG